MVSINNHHMHSNPLAELTVRLILNHDSHLEMPLCFPKELPLSDLNKAK